MELPTIMRLVVVLVLVGGVAPRPATADETDDSLKRVDVAMKALSRSLGSWKLYSHVSEALDNAAVAMAALTPPPKPDLLETEPGASKANQDEIAEENTRRLRAWVGRREAFAKKDERLRALWVKCLARVLSQERFSRTSMVNLYAKENLRALELLTATGRSDAAGEIMTAIEKWVGDLSLTGQAKRLLRAFKALASFNSLDVLSWLRATFIGKEQVLRPLRDICRDGGMRREIIADPVALALRTMVEHGDVPGSLRRKIVRDLVAAYAPLEAKAPRGDIHGDLWLRLKPAAIAATRHFAGEPVDDGGAPLSSMAQLADWFRSNRSPGGDPWKD